LFFCFFFSFSFFFFSFFLFLFFIFIFFCFTKKSKGSSCPCCFPIDFLSLIQKKFFYFVVEKKKKKFRGTKFSFSQREGRTRNTFTYPKFSKVLFHLFLFHFSKISISFTFFYFSKKKKKFFLLLSTPLRSTLLHSTHSSLN